MSLRIAPQTIRYSGFTPNCYRARADQFKTNAHRLLAEGDEEGHQAFLRVADHHETMAESMTVQLAA